jgi:hypothetical protein
LNRLTRCVVAGRLDGADVGIAEDFFAKCLDHALAKRPLGGGVLTVSVMVSDEVQEAVKQVGQRRLFQEKLGRNRVPDGALIAQPRGLLRKGPLGFG